MAERMTNADNFWLCMDDPTNLMVITAFMEFKDLRRSADLQQARW